jgi:hypothetical protein
MTEKCEFCFIEDGVKYCKNKMDINPTSIECDNCIKED